MSILNNVGRRMLLVLALGLLPVFGAAQDTSSAQGFQSGSGPLQSLKRLFGGDSQPDLLPPEQAFIVKLRVSGDTLVADFKPAAGYYLYRDRISFKIAEPSTLKVSGVSLPKGEMKPDPTFGNVEVYHTPFLATVALQRTDQAAASAQLLYSYQGCSELGVCYPPIDKTFDFVLPVVSDVAAATGTGTGAVSGTVINAQSPGPEPQSAASVTSWFDPERSATLFEETSFVWVVAGFFGFGLLLSLTPCVWPMFPILSGIIAGQGASISRKGAFWLSSSYVLGMAVTYAAVGIAAGLSGSLLSTALQTPWVLGGMALIFVILAMSMFGLYEIQLPAFLQSRVATAGNRINKRTTASVFATGAVSAVIVGPCIAAPLAGALLYIGRTQDVVLGGAALFAMALGQGVPLLAVGTSLGSLMPRSGAWMNSIKVFLGVLLLAAALWTISPFMPTAATMALAGVILILFAAYLRVFSALLPEADVFTRMGKGLGVICLLIGAVYVVGAMSGSRSFFEPLSGIGGIGGSAASGEAVAPLQFERVMNVADLDARLQQANGQAVMLDFYADWCVSCKEMEHFTFSDPEVRARLQNVLLLQADVTKNSAEDKALLARFGLFGPPGILFFGQNGQEIAAQRVIGFMNAGRFSEVLDEAFPNQQGR